MKPLHVLFVLLAVVGFYPNIKAEPFLDGYGIIQGVVATSSDSTPLYGVLLSALSAGSETDTMDADLTDSQGRYTLLIPLGNQDSRIVDVHAQKIRYNPEVRPNIVVEFMEIDTLDIYLDDEYGPIMGSVKDSIFHRPIEGVFVTVDGDPSKFAYTDSIGFYKLAVFDSSESGYDVLYSHPEFRGERRDDVIVGMGPRLLNEVKMDRVIWHVSVDGVDGNGRGGQSDPCRTIQWAVDYTNDDDTVLVLPGEYDGLDDQISLISKKIMLRSESGPGETIIDCGQSHRGFRFENDRGSTLRSFTITNGYTAGDGGAILCAGGGSPTITDCVIKGNYSYESSGGGIAVQTSNTSIKVSYCLIENNSAAEKGGGIYVYDGASGWFDHCTIAYNTAGNNGGGITFYDSVDDTVRNCIVWENSAGSNKQIFARYSTPVITYTDVQGGWEGTGNIDSNPYFCHADWGDFHLAANSPCVGSAEDGGDMGAYGVGCADAGVIYGTITDMGTGLPLMGVKVKATTTAGGTVREDYSDVYGAYQLVIPGAPDLAEVWFQRSGYTDITVVDVVLGVGVETLLDMEMEVWGGCSYVIGDYNCSGTFNIADVVEAFSRLKTGLPEPCYVCECPSGDGNYWAVAMDVNNSCTFNVADVTTAFSYLKTGAPELEPCESCPPL